MGKKTRYVILGLLKEENLTGYEIKKCIDRRMRFFWQESYGQIYPELNILVKEGLISEVEARDKETSKREKIKYEISEKGIAALKSWMESENDKDTVRSELLLKCFLATDDNRAELEKHLNNYYMQCAEQVLLFETFHEQLSKDIELHGNHKYILEVLSLGIKQQELYSAWSKQLLKKLSDGEAE
jgi:DNA-binding PadR family transcriptional regulator